MSAAYFFDQFSVSQTATNSCNALTATDASDWADGNATASGFQIRLMDAQGTSVQGESAAGGSNGLALDLQGTLGNKVVMSYGGAGTTCGDLQPAASQTFDLTQGGSVDRFLIPITGIPGAAELSVSVTVHSGWNGASYAKSSVGTKLISGGDGATQTAEILFSNFVTILGSIDLAAIQALDFTVSRANTAGSSTSGMSVTSLGAGDPHFLCLDGSRIDVYEEGAFRLLGLFDDATGELEIAANVRVALMAEGDGADAARTDRVAELAVFDGASGAALCRASFPEMETLVLATTAESSAESDEGPVDRFERTFDLGRERKIVFFGEAAHNTVGARLEGDGWWRATNGGRGGAHVRASGILAGQVLPLDSIEDDGRTRKEQEGAHRLQLARFDTSALCCGGAFAHCVGFRGVSVAPGDASDRLLFSSGNIRALGSFTDNRLDRMRVLEHNDGATEPTSLIDVRFLASSEEGSSEEGGASSSSSSPWTARISAPTTVVELRAIDDVWEDASLLGGRLLVRVQPARTISFALAKTESSHDEQSGAEKERGLLEMPLAPLATTPTADGDTAVGVVSVYERLMEPHMLAAR